MASFTLLATALIAAPAPPSAQAQAPSSSVSGSVGELRGIYCTSAKNCWAVGDTSVLGVVIDQAFHWSGKKWSRVLVPSPGGTAKNDFSELNSVRCTSPKNCWSVGQYEKNNASLDDALHWTGKKWFAVKVPEPGGTAENDFNELSDVACTSATSCWAVGQYGSQGPATEVFLNEMLHWNGAKWSRVTTPDPAGSQANDDNTLDAVRCTSVKNCWAAGDYGVQVPPDDVFNQMLRWNGTKWSKVTVPSPGGAGTLDLSDLFGLSCTSASRCWAVGVYGSNDVGTTQLNQVLRWNGRKWTRASTPNPDGTVTDSVQDLRDVSCTSAANCWAVGHYGNQDTEPAVLDEALHWNGTKWSKASIPSPGGTGVHDESQLRAIRCVNARDCWAVGDQVTGGGAFHNMILHWNGTKWLAS